MQAVTGGILNGLLVTLGDGVSSFAASLVGYPGASMVGYAIRAVAGVAVGVLTAGFMGEERAAFYIAGAFSGIYRQLVQSMPVSSPGLQKLQAAFAGYPQPLYYKGYPARAVAAGRPLRGVGVANASSHPVGAGVV